MTSSRNLSVDSFDMFEGLMENHPSKVLTILMSLLTMTLTTPFLFGIIWYERNGSEIQRKLIDRLASSSCKLLLLIYAVHQMPYLVRFATNIPFNPKFCAFQSFLTNTLLSQSMVQIGSILLVQYLYIFVFKSLGSFNDEFLHTFFVTMSTFGCCIVHGVNAFLPGRWPVFYYICTGTDFDNELPPKFGSTQARSLLPI